MGRVALWVKVRNENRSVPVQSPLGSRSGLGTQPSYEAPDDLWVEYVKAQRLTSGE